MTEVSTPVDIGTTEFDVPQLRRLRYFTGQLLSARDFQREQDYFREKLKLRMRCLLGYGVVCGLFVEPAEHDKTTDKTTDKATDDEAAPAGDERTDPKLHKAKVRLTSGLGVDCDGNEIVARFGCVIDLWDALPEDERDSHTVWVGVEYCERAVEPTRTVYNSSCADTSDCEFGWTDESYVVRVTGKRPPEDERCDTCCSRCEHKVLWLARIDDVRFEQPVTTRQIHMNIRRPFGRHVPTVITGVNWIHGRTYTLDEARELLGTKNEAGGLVVQFSDDVRVDSLQPGVVEIKVIEGGPGRSAGSWYMGAEYEEPGQNAGEFTRRLRYRQTTRESLQYGDQVMITVRTAFILDRCCRPVDGTNVGGKVPYLGGGPRTGDGEEIQQETTGGCQVPPSGVGPWTSGTGHGGDVFESWIFITEERK